MHEPAGPLADRVDEHESDRLALGIEHAGHLERDPAAEADAAKGVGRTAAPPELPDEHADHDVYRHSLRPQESSS